MGQWARRHHGQVEIAPTTVFVEYQLLRATNPCTRSRGRGEQAALEVLNAAIADDPDLEAVLFFEDADLRKRRFVRALPERMMAFSTGDLLREVARIRSSPGRGYLFWAATVSGRSRRFIVAPSVEQRNPLGPPSILGARWVAPHAGLAKVK